MQSEEFTRLTVFLSFIANNLLSQCPEAYDQMVGFIVSEPNFAYIDPNLLTKEELASLGADEIQSGLWILPIFMYPFLQNKFAGGYYDSPSTPTIVCKHRRDPKQVHTMLPYGVFKF
ncbi:MAG: hypothetical protein [Podoviridae sp. ctLUJ1]|nr:MAG: hypothetical protein [Podoviridae sp. ctLUJ1]